MSLHVPIKITPAPIYSFDWYGHVHSGTKVHIYIIPSTKIWHWYIKTMVDFFLLKCRIEHHIIFNWWMINRMEYHIWFNWYIVRQLAHFVFSYDIFTIYRCQQKYSSKMFRTFLTNGCINSVIRSPQYADMSIQLTKKEFPSGRQYSKFPYWKA